MNQTIEEIDFELEKIEKGKNVMDYDCDLKHQKLSNIRSTLCTIEDMKYLPKNTILYFSSKKFTSTNTGNHENFDVYYIKDNDLVKVWMPSLMKEQKGYDTSKYLWYCSGGNYSFTQDIADSISYQVKNESNWFRDERI